MIAGLLFIVANSSYVQTTLAKWVSSSLSKELNTEVNLDKLDLDIFEGFNLRNFIVYDQSNDTLLFAKRMQVSFQNLQIFRNDYAFDALTLDGARIHIKPGPDGRLNTEFLSDYLAGSPEESLSKKSIEKSNPIILTANQVQLIDAKFSFDNGKRDSTAKGIDFNWLYFDDINADFSDIRYDSLQWRFNLNEIRFEEQSGFGLENLKGEFLIDSETIASKNLLLKTAQTSLEGSIALNHGAWSNYSYFLDSVQWDTQFEESVLGLSDIGYFTNALYQNPLKVELSGRIKGPLNDLNGRKLNLRVGDITALQGNFDISGLPNPQTAFMDIRVGSFTTNYDDLEFLKSALTSDPDLLLPEEVRRAGNLRFEGSFTGFVDDFVAYGQLNTEAGSLNLDVKLEADTLLSKLNYGGSVEAVNFDLGRIALSDQLGLVNAKAEVKAVSGTTFETAEINGLIKDLNFKNYDYRGIEVDGVLAPKSFLGNLKSTDPNLDLEFDGLIDLSRLNPVYNFKAFVYNIDLSALKLVNLPLPLSFSSELTLNATGKELNDVEGLLSAQGTYLCYGDSAIYLEELKLLAVGDTTNRRFSFNSDIVDISITGAFNAPELPNSFQNLIAEVLPSFAEILPTKGKEVFDFSVNYKAGNAISGFLVDGLEISQETSIYGSYDSDRRRFGLFLKSGKISFGDIAVNEINLELLKEAEFLKGKTYINAFDIGPISLNNFDADLEAYNDIVELGLGWFNSDQSSTGELELQVFIEDKEHIELRVLDGYLGNPSSTWKINENATIRMAEKRFEVDSLLLTNQDQILSLYGSLDENPKDEMFLKVSDLYLQSIDTLLQGAFGRIKGLANAELSLSDFYGERVLTANSIIENLSYDQFEIGTLRALSSYKGEDEALRLSGSLLREDLKALDFEGSYSIGEEEPLNGKLYLDDFDLNLINALQVPVVTDYSGYASGEIEVTGGFNDPKLKGYIDFDQAKFKVDYLNTYFVFNDRVRVEPDWLGIDYKPLYDSKGKEGYVVASAFHENYRNWSYDFDVETNGFYILNTTRELNNTYFGQAYATGSIQMGGYDGLLEINIDAKTEKGTTLKLPLDEAEELTLENFVYFVNKDEEVREERKADLSGIQMRLDVEATPDAEIQIIFDEQSGDIIRGRGRGKITLEIAPSGEFLMFGRYEIENGDYMFTLKNLVNKKFDLRRGGVIGWYGDPYTADIDISASYDVRTPLHPIMIENQDRYRARENVDVILNLTEKLTNPNISFNIELPQATETERSQLESVVSTSQQLNQQVFALLILNRFLDVVQSQNEQGITGVGVGTTTTSEFLSNQISNWLSDISNEFDIGVNYRPGDEISNQEIAVALSTQLFNERLAVSGNFGVTSASETQASQGQSGILGDFLVEYSLTEEGKIRLKVFNETNPYEVFSNASSIYTQGVGLIYQEDFDTLDEFFDEIKGMFSNDKAKEKTP